MKATTFSIHFLITIVYCGLLFSCTSKIPYGSTYYFPLEPVAKNEKAIPSKEVDQLPVNIVTSVEKIASIAPSADFLLKQANDDLAHIAEIHSSKEVAASSNKKTTQSLSKKEVKLERKEARKALKQTVKEYKHDIKELKKDNAQKDLSKNMKIGIILAAVGLLLLLLVPGPAGYVLGTIGLVVGLVLILIDVL